MVVVLISDGHSPWGSNYVLSESVVEKWLTNSGSGKVKRKVVFVSEDLFVWLGGCYCTGQAGQDLITS